jgi:hypothetical protein
LYIPRRVEIVIGTYDYENVEILKSLSDWFKLNLGRPRFSIDSHVQVIVTVVELAQLSSKSKLVEVLDIFG